MKKFLIAAVLSASSYSANAQTQITLNLDPQQVQTVAHALDVMVRSEGLQAASPALSVLSKMQAAAQDAQKKQPEKADK